MCIKKEYFAQQPVCKVKFKLPRSIVKTATRVYLTGDFNNWNTSGILMKKTKKGSFSTALTLETGKEYQFRYLIDSKYWENDRNADKYVISNIGGHSENSVVVI